MSDVVVVMGVSGAGKSTIGRRLADRFGFDFIEGDDLHPATNIERMARGEPLDDEARRPWLDAIAAEIARHHQEGRPGVVTCSALRRRYRDRLRDTAPILFVYLAPNVSQLEDHLHGRDHDFMPDELLADQLVTLEPPAPDESDIIIIRPAGTVDATVDDTIAHLADRGWWHGTLGGSSA